MGFFSDLFKGRKDTTTLEPMLTPEQQQALSMLLQFGSTGKIGDFQAGQGYDLSGFDFGLSGVEGKGRTLLENLLSSGNPSALNQAEKTLTGFTNQTFNPDDPSSGFGAFKRQLARATKDSSDVLNREAAITGNRFGTQISKDKADLASQQSDILASELGRLYDTSQNRSLQAAQGLSGIGALQEQINQSRISQAFQLGGLERDLKNQEANLKYNEFQRQRNERLSSIGSLNTVLNKNVDFGLKSITTERPSVFQSLLGEINPFVGSYNNQKYGNVPNQANMGEAVQALIALLSGGAGGGGGAGGVGGLLGKLFGGGK